jgi:2-oxoglutarate/2-oxoacid ferredoxin oxidoreductase subunit beta
MEVTPPTATAEPKPGGGRQAYRSQLKPVWCPGCGDYGVLSSLYAALAELQIPPHQIALISGIGCSSRLPGYAATYGLNTIHGRPVPVATGLKAARPDLTVIAMAGDGDGLSIGGGHFPHAARRNIDMAYIIMDNNIYGLTKGQTSPTTPMGERTATSLYGWPEDSANPLSLALAYGVTFVAQGMAGDVKGLARLFVEAIRWPGFAFLEVLSPCVTWMGKTQYDIIRERARPLPAEHDVTDLGAAFRYATDPEHLYMGVYYRQPKPSFQDRIAALQQNAVERGAGSMESMLARFRT